MRSNFIIPLILITSLFSCNEVEKKSDSIRKVKCAEAVSADQNYTSVTYPGKVYAATDVNLSFRVPGVIDKIAVKEGDFVREDEVVAYMDDRDYKIQLEATQAEYDGINSEASRVITLYKEQSVSENDYDKAVNGLKRITSKLESHRNALEDTKLKAPFSGYIQKINFDKGEAVSAGMPIISFVSSAAPEVIVNIPISEYIKMGELLSASATSDTFKDKIFPLKHLGTTRKANLNQLHEARFTLGSTDGISATPGMSVMVTLNFNEQISNTTIIPFSAVLEKDNKTYVWLLSNKTATLKEVSLGKIKSNGTVIINSGINCGDLVISAGINSLKEGEKVEQLAQPSKSNIGNIL